MAKIIQRIVVITIIETWTILWADGTERTVTFRASQRSQLLLDPPSDPQDENDRNAIGSAVRRAVPDACPQGGDFPGEATDSTAGKRSQRVP